MTRPPSPSKPRSLFDKLWQAHEVVPESVDAPAVMYIDLHLIHEVTSPQAFEVLRRRRLGVHARQRTLATMDHATPTTPRDASGQWRFSNPQAKAQVEQLARNCREFGIALHDMESADRGVVHVMGPELGATQPGMTIVCGDSHTSTHGAFGALAFGIGTTEVGHVLATQCLLQRKPRSLRIIVDGELGPGVSAKDLVLAIIQKIGVHGGTGHVIEYAGPAIRALSMEQRMTICNMSIEAGARAGLIAADATTIEYLRHRPMVPQGAEFDAAADCWLTFSSDEGAHFDREVHLDASTIRPWVTWGTHPGMSAAIDGQVPRPADALEQRAQAYMGLRAEQALAGHPVDVVFVGSCTNGRITDLRDAANVLRGRRIDPRVRMLVVPGSQAVRRQAEQEGLDRVFIDAGAQWREPGCSMCIAMNGDQVAPGETAVSTSNRNFEGRQGSGARTLLASPATAAASALHGALTDPRMYLESRQEVA
jgi:3-isopropylmalate/(R)-2-methylmalate dehydratase large subunit